LVINSSQGTPKNLIVLDKDEAAALLGRRDSSGSFDDPEEPPPPPVVEEVEEDEGVAVEVKAVAVEPEPVVEESEAESEASNESIHPSAERLLECARSGDDEMVGKLLVAGTEWDCETRVVRRAVAWIVSSPLAERRERLWLGRWCVFAEQAEATALGGYHGSREVRRGAAEES
jgi:hypothetical protein